MSSLQVFYEGYSSGDVIKVASKEEPGVKVIIWLYAPFVMVSMLNLQYVIWAACTGGKAWRNHHNAAFSRSFFLLLANIWLTNLLHGALILIANIYTFRPLQEDVHPVHNPNHLLENTTTIQTPPTPNWGMVLRLGIPLTVATHGLSNLAAIALTMSAESTLISASACADCDANMSGTFRSRILSIIAGIWALDIILIFLPLLAHMINETFFQTILYSWAAYIAIMAEIWIVILCILAYVRARKVHRDDPEYCPQEVLQSIRRKSIIIITMTMVIYLTLLPWPICEIIYADSKLFHLIIPYVKGFVNGMQSKNLYSYMCALPYVHFLIQSILVIAFKETRWRFCLGRRNQLSEEVNLEDEKEQEEEQKKGEKMEEKEQLQQTSGFSTLSGRGQQRTSFIQGGLFAENLETLRLGLNGAASRTNVQDDEDYGIPKETSV